jgi:predicted  nucleic acid-binding Zn-ribbon protein
MKQSSRIIFLSVMFLLLAGAVQTAQAQVSRESDQKQTVQELLEEVRMLRQVLQTLQRMSVDTYRSQLLVDRIRVIREDIRRLTDSLNNARDTLAKTQSTIPQFIERQKLLENRAQSEVDQNKRAELEFEARQTKDAIERYKSSLEPLKAREQELAAELNAAKARAEELESRLDLLERAIENDRQKLENANQSKTP